MTDRRASIPCTIVTGALGSGKTTLIRSLLEQPDMAGTALIVNEFGEVGLDHLILSSAVETTLLMDSGCLCCSLRGDIVDTVLSLFSAVERGDTPPFDRILIETTGLADPIPIVRDLTSSPALRDRVHLCRVVTCVDGLVGQAELRSNDVAVDQVAQADVCLITKTDLADPLQIDLLSEALTLINPLVSVVRVVGEQGASSDLLFGAGPVEMHRPQTSGERAAALDLKAGGHDHDHHHDHEHHDSVHTGVDSWSTVISHSLPWQAIRDWIDLVYSLNAARILRAKGVLWIQESDKPVLFQAVGPILSPPVLLSGWEGRPPESRLVFITKNFDLEILELSFENTVLRGVAECP